MDRDRGLREHLLYLMKGGGAHLNFQTAISGLPVDLRGAKSPGIPHTPWRLLEHMRIAQWDILEFSRNSKHVSPEFPNGYWPGGAGFGYGYQMDGYSGMTPTGYRNIRPSYELRILVTSANILAQHGQQQTCEDVLTTARSSWSAT